MGQSPCSAAGLPKRMMTFAWQSVASMIVALVVWNRSEVILLKHLCSDIRQIAFYSLAFSMAEQLLISSTVFGSAAGATIFAQIGRDKSSFRSHGFHVSLPGTDRNPATRHRLGSCGAGASVFYGNQYRGAVMVLTLAPLLCLPKASMWPVQSLLQTMERQSYLMAATVLAGSSILASPGTSFTMHGAVGACIGSGAAQVTAIG